MSHLEECTEPQKGSELDKLQENIEELFKYSILVKENLEELSNTLYVSERCAEEDLCKDKVQNNTRFDECSTTLNSTKNQLKNIRDITYKLSHLIGKKV